MIQLRELCVMMVKGKAAVDVFLLVTLTSGLLISMFLIMSSVEEDDPEMTPLPPFSREFDLATSQLRHNRHQNCQTDVKKPRYYSQSGEDRALYLRYFSSPPLCHGVYVEIGALDGVTYSNTKFFEDSLNWTGVLIEAHPQNAARLMKNRARSNNVIIREAVCAAGVSYVNFTGSFAVAGVPETMTRRHKERFYHNRFSRIIQVPCRPMASMLQRSGVLFVDLFVVDVEGAELTVLQTMDWTIPVRVFLVEMGHGSRDDEVVDLLASKGYQKTKWNIRDYCPPQKDCANNQVFENIHYTVTF